MSFLDNVTEGKVKTPEFMIVYGTPGVGKTTFGIKAPEHIIVPTEDGSQRLPGARRGPLLKTYEEVNKALEELLTKPHKFKTLVFDSLDWFEPMIWDVVAKAEKKNNIEDIGYKKGYIFALDYWKSFLEKLREIREKREMNVVMIAHSLIKKFEDPTQAAGYDRYQLKLHDKAGALLTEAVDTMLFATEEVYLHEGQGKKARALGEGKRVLYTQRRPSFEAKNRDGLPEKIDLSWDSYMEHVTSSGGDAVKSLKEEIESYIAQVTDAELKANMEKGFRAAGDSKENLEIILNRIKTRLA